MNRIYQTTISSKASLTGVGLHSGNLSKINLYPSKEDSGITFKRIDLTKNNIVKANFSKVSSARLCTTLENDHGVKVSTVEHLLAALYIADIDNVLVEIDNEEVPIMDGSAKNFLEVFNNLEIKNLNKKRKYLKVLEKVELTDGERKISIEPNDFTFEVDFQLNYKNKIIGKQRNKVNFQIDDLKDITDSRTFCLYEDIEKIKKNGLAKGGSLDNAIVVDDYKILNKEGLRNNKEFVNHKILDLAGDFLLSGHRVIGKIKCYQGGHQLTNIFLRKLFNEKSSTKLVELENIFISNKNNTDQTRKIAVNA
jgi:UDP-3-O-[3-hydroxymyristoyl] N-acetylglucosamine deacetylase